MDELSFSGLRHEYYCCGTLYYRVLRSTKYISIGCKSYQVPGNHVIDQILTFLQPLTSSLCHSEARNDQGRRVKLEFEKICDLTAESHEIMCL